MPNNGLFDTKRDNQLIITGSHFWCETCFVARPLDDQSSDPRYCQGCYDFLLKEAEVLRESGSTRHPGWIPKKPQRAQENQCPIPSHRALNMSTLESKKSEVDIITPSVSTRPIVKRIRRGPKHRTDLPVEVIMQWAGEGMGSKVIAARLKAEHGIIVSYKTIQRILAGQRVLV